MQTFTCFWFSYTCTYVYRGGGGQGGGGGGVLVGDVKHKIDSVIILMHFTLRFVISTHGEERNSSRGPDKGPRQGGLFTALILIHNMHVLLLVVHGKYKFVRTVERVFS